MSIRIINSGSIEGRPTSADPSSSAPAADDQSATGITVRGVPQALFRHHRPIPALGCAVQKFLDFRRADSQARTLTNDAKLATTAVGTNRPAMAHPASPQQIPLLIPITID